LEDELAVALLGSISGHELKKTGTHTQYLLGLQYTITHISRMLTHLFIHSFFPYFLYSFHKEWTTFSLCKFPKFQFL